ncbi:DUF3304 domain-containing protein [Citrobacter werkmanii]|nr:DUF3304 domain-containing protein [Citrobacter werkmanii]MDN8559319.1 DUF3304 domain-containing protein [Citrobacter werkmanii]
MVLVCLMFSGLIACRDHSQDGMSGAELNVTNHGPDAIVSVQANGYGGPAANSYGGGGGFCCVMVPDVWRPGLTAQITWTSDPNGWMKHEDAPDNYSSHYQHHGPVTVPIERWEKGQDCGFDVHIWPCDKVRIVRSCYSVGDPRYPIPPEPHQLEKAMNILEKHIQEKVTCPTPQTPR